MNKRTLRIAVIAIVILLIAAVFIAKRAGTGSLSDMQDSIDSAASSLQSGREPLELTGFDPSMIEESSKPMILVMGESWCQPCLRMIPDLTDLHRNIDDVTIRYIDLEENPAAKEYFPIRVTPTIAVYGPGGEPYDPPEDLGINFMMYTYRDSGEHAFTIHEGYLYREQLDALIEALRNA